MKLLTDFHGCDSLCEQNDNVVEPSSISVLDPADGLSPIPQGSVSEVAQLINGGKDGD